MVCLPHGKGLLFEFDHTKSDDVDGLITISRRTLSVAARRSKVSQDPKMNPQTESESYVKKRITKKIQDFKIFKACEEELETSHKKQSVEFGKDITDRNLDCMQRK